MLLQAKGVVGACVVAMFLIGCAAAGDIAEPQDRAGSGTEAAPRMAIINYTGMDLSDPAMLQEYSRAEMIITTPVGLWNVPRNDGKLAEMRALNPNLKIIGYINAHSSWLSWGVALSGEVGDGTYARDWYQATRPYWSYTTTGDTMMSWPGKVLLDILDPACRSAMVGVIAAHWYAHANVLDGVFWDHFNNLLWVPRNLPGVEGQMDLDGDGIAHREDEDEMQAYRQASASLIIELRSALGPGVIQIVNGGRAAQDSVFAGLVDGMMYENFPEVGFRQGGMRQALDLAQPNNLFAAQHWPRTSNGGPWLILSNKYVSSFYDSGSQPVVYKEAEFSRVAAALTGCLVSYHPPTQTMRYDWPAVELDLGLPVGSVVFGVDSVAREFENGSVRLDFTAGVTRFPFDFEITEGGEVAQAFQYPSHFP